MRVILEDGTFIYASKQNCKIGFDNISYRYTHRKILQWKQNRDAESLRHMNATGEQKWKQEREDERCKQGQIRNS